MGKEKHFVKIVTILVTVLSKIILYLSIYFAFDKKSIILSLFKIDTLNFTMYILTILTCSLKKYIRLHNLISMNFFFFIIVKRQPKTNCWSKRTIRSSRSLMIFKIGVLKNFLTCKGKHQYWSLFSACNFIKKDSNTVVFL